MGDNGFHEMAACADCRKIGRIASKALGDPTPVELDTRESTEVGLVRMLAARLAEAERLLRKWVDGSNLDGWETGRAWEEVSAFLGTADSASGGE